MFAQTESNGELPLSRWSYNINARIRNFHSAMPLTCYIYRFFSCYGEIPLTAHGAACHKPTCCSYGCQCRAYCQSLAWDILSWYVGCMEFRTRPHNPAAMRTRYDELGKPRDVLRVWRARISIPGKRSPCNKEIQTEPNVAEHFRMRVLNVAGSDAAFQYMREYSTIH